MRSNIDSIVFKELSNFFSSLTAYVFLGSFLAVTLFVFFWVDAFFARYVADVRSLFEWMPVLMALLVSALTMRMWSEERRTGTIEFLLSSPISNFDLVLGKFTACMLLVLIALFLTLPLPITVAVLGPLDWGPVVGGYLASTLLAAAYTAIGLQISSRTENQLVSLLLSILVCTLFVLIGSEQFTGFFNSSTAELLSLFGTGSRFQSITRGVIDFRDLYYYLSLTGTFLSLNILGLETVRWSGNRSNSRHKTWIAITALCMANFLMANFWLQEFGNARIDLTDGRIYSISETTRKYLNNLKEPLVIRAYFSKTTHPALVPLIPRLRDLLREYQIASKNKIHLDFIDPSEKPEYEREAADYGIKPVTFPIVSKYQTTLTSTYFDILVKYGDQYQKIGFKDLLDVKSRSQKDFDVELRNPEYDITKTIKMVINSYQGRGNPFAGIDKKIEFVGYVSGDKDLSAPMIAFKKALLSSLNSLEKKSGGKFSYKLQDPDADGGALAKQLENDYGMRPLAASPGDAKTFWFYLTMHSANDPSKIVAMAPPNDLKEESLNRIFQNALKRFSKGSIKTLGICAPPPSAARFVIGYDYNKVFSVLLRKLAQSYNITDVNLVEGRVPENVDLLLVLDPENYSEKQVFALDQFLMHGGTIIVGSSAFDCTLSGALKCKEIKSGLEDWLKSFGIEIKKSMVLDPQCFPFPIPGTKRIGIAESSQLLPYPYFVDVRADGMNKDELLTSRLSQVTLNWTSPIVLDKKRGQQLKFTELLHSSAQSWTSNSTDVVPVFSDATKYGFKEEGKKGRQLLGVAAEGRFASYFTGKKNPLLDASGEQKNTPEKKFVDTFLEKSPESARLILFSSNTFLVDQLIYMESTVLQNQYLNAVELVQNAVDWSLEDKELLAIRRQGFFSRPLRVNDQTTEFIFEQVNYGLACFGILMLWLIKQGISKAASRRDQALVNKTLALAATASAQSSLSESAPAEESALSQQSEDEKIRTEDSSEKSKEGIS